MGGGDRKIKNPKSALIIQGLEGSLGYVNNYLEERGTKGRKKRKRKERKVKFHLAAHCY